MQNPLSLKTRLERITKGELEKMRRAFSWIIAAILLAKIGSMFRWVDLTQFVAKYLSQSFVDTFITPNAWHWWQITLATDALLTFLLLFFADAALARLDST
jgi:hypothetical protein